MGSKGKLALWTLAMPIGVAYNVWSLAAPGEALNIAVAVLTWFALIGMSLGLVIGIIGLIAPAAKSTPGK
jgi:hypothetical protein